MSGVGRMPDSVGGKKNISVPPGASVGQSYKAGSEAGMK